MDFCEVNPGASLCCHAHFTPIFYLWRCRHANVRHDSGLVIKITALNELLKVLPLLQKYYMTSALANRRTYDKRKQQFPVGEFIGVQFWVQVLNRIF